MSLEGRLRDLGLAEVLQLLALSRKSGTLHLEAPLQGRRAAIHFQQGSVIDARSWNDHTVAPESTPRHATESREVEAVVLDLLLWRDGAFHFTAQSPLDESASLGAAIRLSVEPLLMEAAQRAEVWARIADRVPHSRVVPTFVDIEPQQLPLLRLTPAQWEILTRVDGERDLLALSEALGFELLDVAERVHGLLVVGLLTLREGPIAPRRNATPPAMHAVVDLESADIGGDLWIPSVAHTRHSSRTRLESADSHDEDSIFDPVQLGVISPDGMPLRRTPWMASPPVASEGAEPSLPRGETAEWAPRAEGARLCLLGDDAARRGDFKTALDHWNAALRQPESIANAEQVREAIALTARLHALLHP